MRLLVMPHRPMSEHLKWPGTGCKFLLDDYYTTLFSFVPSVEDEPVKRFTVGHKHVSIVYVREHHDAITRVLRSHDIRIEPFISSDRCELVMHRITHNDEALTLAKLIMKNNAFSDSAIGNIQELLLKRRIEELCVSDEGRRLILKLPEYN
jgi:hypothetical protein